MGSREYITNILREPKEAKIFGVNLLWFCGFFCGFFLFVNVCGLLLPPSSSSSPPTKVSQSVSILFYFSTIFFLLYIWVCVRGFHRFQGGSLNRGKILVVSLSSNWGPPGRMRNDDE